MHIDRQLVTVVELQRVAGDDRLIAKACVWPRWRHRDAVLGDDRVVDRLRPQQIVARGVVRPDQCSSSTARCRWSSRRTTCRPDCRGVGAAHRTPARRVELHLHEGCARRRAEVIGRLGIGALVDVRVAIRRAGHRPGWARPGRRTSPCRTRRRDGAGSSRCCPFRSAVAPQRDRSATSNCRGSSCPSLGPFE